MKDTAKGGRKRSGNLDAAAREHNWTGRTRSRSPGVISNWNLGSLLLALLAIGIGTALAAPSPSLSQPVERSVVGTAPDSLRLLSAPPSLDACQNVKWTADLDSPSRLPGSRPQFLPSCADQSLEEAEVTVQARYKSRQSASRQPFFFTFTCHDTPLDVCEKARAGFEEAGARVAKVLKLNETISVNATFRPFCDDGATTGASCARFNQTLGMATPASMLVVTLRSGDQWTIPQALVRQIFPPEKLSAQLEPFDIVADFNSDFNFHFPSDLTTISNTTKQDFIWVAVHELIHGLGFTARIGNFMELLGLTTEGLVTPAFAFSSSVLSTDPTFRLWEPPAYFNDRLRSGSPSRDEITPLIRTISNWKPPSGTRFSQFFETFKSSGAPYEAARKLYQISTGGFGSMVYSIAAGAPVGGDTDVVMYSPPEFRSGSSISHLSQQYTYNRTLDFLMVRFADSERSEGNQLNGAQLISLVPNFPFS